MLTTLLFTVIILVISVVLLSIKVLLKKEKIQTFGLKKLNETATVIVKMIGSYSFSVTLFSTSGVKISPNTPMNVCKLLKKPSGTLNFPIVPWMIIFPNKMYSYNSTSCLYLLTDSRPFIHKEYSCTQSLPPHSLYYSSFQPTPFDFYSSIPR